MSAIAAAKQQTIKISSKRQITIPAKCFKSYGFGEYALCTETEDGLLIQPLNAKNEDVSVAILRQLVEEGLEGEELIQRYKEYNDKLVSFNRAVEEAAEDMVSGRTRPFSELRAEIRGRYGI